MPTSPQPRTRPVPGSADDMRLEHPDEDATTVLPVIPAEPVADTGADEAPTQEIPAAASDPDLEHTREITPVPAPWPPRPPAGAAPAPRRRRRIGRLVLGVAAALVLVLGWSIGTALARPVSESPSAKLAEWGRDHHLGALVTWLEKKQYELHPPRTGGTLAGGIRVGGGTPTPRPSAHPSQAAVPPHTAAPANLVPIVHDGAYPNEGVWQPLVTGSGGLPLVLGTAIRPDATHTSYQVGIAWMDPKRVRFELHPGQGEPPGTWSTSPTLGTSTAEQGLVAAFNAGFRLPGGQSRGGWYLDGTWVYPPRTGAESFVVYKDGHAAVGTWGTDVGLTPQVVAVRQNLDPLLLQGQSGVTVNPTVDESNTITWGFTLGQKAYVARSGVGITKTGAIVYAAGLTNTRTLANVLRDAGCVRAMELDINPEWTIYTYFAHGTSGTVTATSPGPVTGTRLTPDEQAAADHFLTSSARDFFAVYAR